MKKVLKWILPLPMAGGFTGFMSSYITIQGEATLPFILIHYIVFRILLQIWIKPRDKSIAKKPMGKKGRFITSMIITLVISFVLTATIGFSEVLRGFDEVIYFIIWGGLFLLIRGFVFMSKAEERKFNRKKKEIVKSAKSTRAEQRRKMNKKYKKSQGKEVSEYSAFVGLIAFTIAIVITSGLINIIDIVGISTAWLYAFLVILAIAVATFTAMWCYKTAIEKLS